MPITGPATPSVLRLGTRTPPTPRCERLGRIVPQADQAALSKTYRVKNAITGARALVTGGASRADEGGSQ
jgi:hypothetical protein